MSPLLALVVGLVVGAGLVAAVVATRRRIAADAVGDGPDPTREQQLARRLVDLMDPAVVVLDADEAVLLANPAARALGVVRGTRVQVPEVLQVARDAREGGSRRVDVALPGELGDAGSRLLGVHGLPLGAGPGPRPEPVALVLLDATEARRVEAMRRDFVANIGHELKTPVGALALLAEAVQDAADDPKTVRRFADRMAHEADRLARLVREVLDLSRLEGGEPLPDLVPVDVDSVLAEAADRTGLAAAAKQIEIVVGGQPELVVRGVEAQLATAVTNLLANAVAYSPDRARVAVAARARAGFVEIAVTDSGIGIPPQERARLFERFYRVDQSRASRTGGTGLGLAIVKHVASNHGGSVSVWSEEGLGSTFTLRIPLADVADGPGGEADPSTVPEPATAPGRGEPAGSAPADPESPTSAASGGVTEGRT